MSDGDDVAGVFNFGYTHRQQEEAREQNRMFHRGLALSADSLGSDVFVFSRSRDALGGVGAVHLARYGPELNRVARQAYDDDRLEQQTLSAQIAPDGRLRMYGTPEDEQAAVSMLLDGSVFADAAELCAFATARFAERPVGLEAPGFVGAIVLKPGLGITCTDGDIKQGATSLRSVLPERYVPAGVGLSGVSAPTCQMTLQRLPLQLPSWDPARSSPVYSRKLRLSTGAPLGGAAPLFVDYSLELRIMMVDADAAAKQPDWSKPRACAVLDGNCIAVGVSLDDTLLSLFVTKTQEAAWNRRADGRMYGHEKNGFSQLVQLCGHAAQTQTISVQSTELHVGSADGAPLTSDRRVSAKLLSAERYSKYSKQARALLAGCGTRAVASLKPLGGAAFDAGNLLSADKDVLRNPQLAQAVRQLYARALVHCHRQLFELRYGAGAEMRFEAVLAEEAEKHAADAAEQQREAETAAAQAAQAAALRRAKAHEQAAQHERAKAALAREAARCNERTARAAEALEQARRKAERESAADARQRNHAVAQQRNAAKAAAAKAAAEMEMDDDNDEEAGLVVEEQPRGRGRAAAGADEGAGAAAAVAEEAQASGVDDNAPTAPAAKRLRRDDKPAPAPLPSHCLMCQQAMDRRTAAAAMQRREEELRALLRGKDETIEVLERQLRHAQGRE